MWPNATMGDAPEPPRPLRWLHVPRVADPDEEAAPDPEGRWLAEHAEGAAAEPRPVLPSGLAAMLRDGGRWAPQHGARGRSDSALPGAFFPLETEPPGFHVPPGLLEPETAVLPAPRDRSRSALAREVIETILLAIIVFLAVRASVHHYRVEGQSMDPTLVDGEFLLVNALVYSQVNVEKLSKWVPGWDPGEPNVRHVFHGPERGDIIVFNHPQSQSQRDLVKRVIAVPGDTIAIRNNAVFINGRQLVEPYVANPRQDDMAELTLPEDHYFVMGDNRGNSLDSRTFGPIHIDLIVGKALASWWPRDKIGLAPNQEATYLDPPATEAD
jgi:signal peptidase I